MQGKINFFLAGVLLLTTLTVASCTFEMIKPPPPQQVVLKSFHNRYVTALGKNDNWTLKQETESSDCARFTMRHLANGKITLETCQRKYVVAPQNGATRENWMLGQEDKLSDCGQFDLYELGNNRVAFKTCAGRFITAGDGSWPGELAWAVVGETDILDAWEIFTALPQ